MPEFPVDLGPLKYNEITKLSRPTSVDGLSAEINSILYTLSVAAGEIPYYLDGLANWPFLLPDTLEQAIKVTLGSNVSLTQSGTILTCDLEIQI